MSIKEFRSEVVDLTSTLRPFALNLTRDGEDASDLLQETMLRAITNQDKFRDGTNLKAWLFTIMRNIFINNYRRKSKRNTIVDQTENQYYLNSAENAIDNAATRSFVMKDAMRAINNLSNDYRIPFMMHYEGFKYHEIADKLRLPLGTVKSRIFFARKELKEQLKVYAKND